MLGTVTFFCNISQLGWLFLGYYKNIKCWGNLPMSLKLGKAHMNENWYCDHGYK